MKLFFDNLKTKINSTHKNELKNISRLNCIDRQIGNNDNDNFVQVIKGNNEHKSIHHFRSSLFNGEKCRVTMEGYVEKESKSMFGKIVMKKKYLVVKGNYLLFYRSNETNIPLKNIVFDLIGSSISEECVTHGEEEKFKISVTLANGNSVCVFVKDFEYKEEWMKCLNIAKSNYKVVGN